MHFKTLNFNLYHRVNNISIRSSLKSRTHSRMFFFAKFVKCSNIKIDHDYTLIFWKTSTNWIIKINFNFEQKRSSLNFLTCILIFVTRRQKNELCLVDKFSNIKQLVNSISLNKCKQNWTIKFENDVFCIQK